jgi:hypothetical protein
MVIEITIVALIGLISAKGAFDIYNTITIFPQYLTIFEHFITFVFLISFIVLSFSSILYVFHELWIAKLRT